MHIHIAKFTFLILCSLALLFFTDNSFVMAISYFVIIVSAYLILTAFMVPRKNY